MQKNENPASGGTLGGADCSAQQQNNPTLKRGENKAPAAGSESRRLIAARYSPALPQTALSAALVKALARRAVSR